MDLLHRLPFRQRAFPQSINEDKADDLIVGYAPGVYDLFHVGHLNVLQRARERCDYLIAGVTTDETVAVAKGAPPMIPLEDRMAVLAALNLVDQVAIDEFPIDKLAMWHRLHFDVIFKGDDWRGTAKGDQLERDMASVGASVVYFPYTQHVSSTKLRALIASANERHAKQRGSSTLDTAPASVGNA